jgi:CheY-like chemotaxis protein
LAVDDDRSSRRTVRRALDDEGQRGAIAADGVDAINIATGGQPQWAIFDGKCHA